MTPSEFSRRQAVDTLGDAPRRLDLAADEAERAALARRFALIAIDRLEASLTLRWSDAEVIAEGQLDAAITQACAATGEAVPAKVQAPFEIRFRPLSDAAAAGEKSSLAKATWTWCSTATARSTSARRLPRPCCSTSTPIRARPAPSRR